LSVFIVWKTNQKNNPSEFKRSIKNETASIAPFQSEALGQNNAFNFLDIHNSNL